MIMGFYSFSKAASPAEGLGIRVTIANRMFPGNIGGTGKMPTGAVEKMGSRSIIKNLLSNSGLVDSIANNGRSVNRDSALIFKKPCGSWPEGRGESPASGDAWDSRQIYRRRPQSPVPTLAS